MKPLIAAVIEQSVWPPSEPHDQRVEARGPHVTVSSSLATTNRSIGAAPIKRAPPPKPATPRTLAQTVRLARLAATGLSRRPQAPAPRSATLEQLARTGLGPEHTDPSERAARLERLRRTGIDGSSALTSGVSGASRERLAEMAQAIALRATPGTSALADVAAGIVSKPCCAPCAEHQASSPERASATSLERDRLERIASGGLDGQSLMALHTAAMGLPPDHPPPSLVSVRSSHSVAMDTPRSAVIAKANAATAAISEISSCAASRSCTSSAASQSGASVASSRDQDASANQDTTHLIRILVGAAIDFMARVDSAESSRNRAFDVRVAGQSQEAP